MARAGEYTIILHVDSPGYKTHDTDALASEWIKTLACPCGVETGEVDEAVKVWA
eukprot:jgi/Ulvmu1/2115/UM126_0008.1